jgi:undecaprenyl-diphosphatase
MFLTTGALTDLNLAVFRALNLAGSHPVADAAFVAFTIAGAAYGLTVLVGLLFARGHKVAAFDVLAAILVTLVATEGLRYAFGEPRPCQVLSDARTLAFVGCPADPAFPSGHASRAFGVAVVLAFRFPPRFGGAAIGAAALIALSRVYLGVHWPSDVVGGAALGIGLGLLLEALARRSRSYVSTRAAAIALADRAIRRVRRR